MQRTNTEIAESIRALAGARGVTLKQTLADCGINRNFIYDLEHGNSSPSVDKIARIAAYFGVRARPHRRFRAHASAPRSSSSA